MAKRGGAVPIVKDILADFETPLSGYWKLAHDETYSFLLESVTGGEHLARYSYIGVRPRTLLRETLTDPISAQGHDPLDVLRGAYPAIHPALAEGLPKFLGGAVGLISYDYIRTIETIPVDTVNDLELPEVAFMVTQSLVVFDHAKNLVRLIVLADGSEKDFEAATTEIERLEQKLAAPLPALPHFEGQPHPVKANLSQDEYESNVGKVKAYIAQGDAFQVVPSLRFQTQLEAHPLSVYRALRSVNPSPYMFLLRFGDFDVVGASPELQVGLEAGVARVRPIAGTRPRGMTEAEDRALATDLLADEKEQAEHIMLLDLGRNDLGRVSKYGTVVPGDLMVIEKYSHVMHIVSSITGELKESDDAISLVRASFPAGTVSGAPKVRAMEIIEELEPTRRGLYGGAVGYFSASGDVDLAMALRTILIKDGYAYVQAGAGVVFDSDPAKEYAECCNKARAPLHALELAQQGL